MGQSSFSESPMDGIGFGLGVAVVINPAKSQLLRSPGRHHTSEQARAPFATERFPCMFNLWMLIH